MCLLGHLRNRTYTARLGGGSDGKDAHEKKVQSIPSSVTHGHTVMAVLFEDLVPSPELKTLLYS